jgi:hypothetical protein
MNRQYKKAAVLIQDEWQIESVSPNDKQTRSSSETLVFLKRYQFFNLHEELF